MWIHDLEGTFMALVSLIMRYVFSIVWACELERKLALIGCIRCACAVSTRLLAHVWYSCTQSAWNQVGSALWAFKRLTDYLSLVSAIPLLRAQATALVNFFLISRPILTCILLKFIGYAFFKLIDVFSLSCLFQVANLSPLWSLFGVLCSRSDV